MLMTQENNYYIEIMLTVALILSECMIYVTWLHE